MSQKPEHNWGPVAQYQLYKMWKTTVKVWQQKRLHIVSTAEMNKNIMHAAYFTITMIWKA